MWNFRLGATVIALGARNEICVIALLARFEMCERSWTPETLALRLCLLRACLHSRRVLFWQRACLHRQRLCILLRAGRRRQNLLCQRAENLQSAQLLDLGRMRQENLQRHQHRKQQLHDKPLHQECDCRQASYILSGSCAILNNIVYALQSSECANQAVYLQQDSRAVSDSPLFLQPSRTRERTLDGTFITPDRSQLVFCPNATPTSSPTHKAHAQQKSIAVMFSSREEQKSSL
jgi:hypothetical protein